MYLSQAGLFPAQLVQHQGIIDLLEFISRERGSRVVEPIARIAVVLPPSLAVASQAIGAPHRWISQPRVDFIGLEDADGQGPVVVSGSLLAEDRDLLLLGISPTNLAVVRRQQPIDILEAH